MRGTDSRRTGDEGFTLVEVMIAAAILFIVLTGVLGLLMQSTNMGIQSKQNVVFSNVVNSYVERVQQMKFDKVVVGTGVGELASVETTTVQEYTITITPTVESLGAGLKKLIIVASLTNARGDAQNMTTDVLIRDKDRMLTEGANPPEITWGVSNPAYDEVVWEALRSSGGPLWISVSAKGLDGKKLRSMTIKADGPIVQDTFGNQATIEWESGSQPAQHTMTLIWNTEQKKLDASTETTVPAIADGRRTILVIVIDSAGVERSSSRTVIVDNFPPGKPSSAPIASIADKVTAKLTWGAASDGSDAAASYKVFPQRQSTDGTWTALPTLTTSTTSSDLTVEPFSRYWVEVGSVGLAPRLREDPAKRLGMTTSLITPPAVSGTASSTNNANVKVDLRVTQPQFAASGVSYKWEWATYTKVGNVWQWSAWTSLASTAVATDTFSEKNTPRYYRCEVKYTPVGADPGGGAAPAAAVFRSDVLGPTPTGTTAVAPLASQVVPW